MLPDGWKEGKFQELATLQRGFDLPVQDRKIGKHPIFASNRQIGWHDDYKVKGPGVITGRSGTVGKVTFSEHDFWPLNTTLFVKDFHGNSPEYVCRFIDFFNLERFATGSGVPTLNRNDVHPQKVGIPPIFEQKEINKILSIWDKSIDAFINLIEIKQKQKKALMQRLLTGKHRFPEFVQSDEMQETRYGDIPADWGYVHINEVAAHVSTKNKDGRELPVLSCTKHHGLVNSADYFDKRVHSKDLSTYKIIKKEQFAYATNHIEEGSIGYQSLHDEAVISPMYTIFKTNDKIDDGYLFKLVKTDLYRHIFGANTNASVDRRGSLRWPDFSKLYIPLPSIPEQQKIAAVLDIVDKEIGLLTQKLEAYKEQKKGLMQQLLTGKKRVKLGQKEKAVA